MEIDIVPINPDYPVCDFCSSRDPRSFDYPCRDFKLPEYGFKSYGWFRACPKCHALIEAGDWAGLECRSADTFHMKYAYTGMSKELTKAFVHALHTAFREHRQ